MGSCIKVVKTKKIGFLLKKKSFQGGHILVTKQCTFCPKKCPIFCHGYSQNYKLTPAPSEIASQFPPPLTFE
jgi:hypothetical protein